MKTKRGSKLTLCLEILLTLFIVGLIVGNSLDNVHQEVLQYESGLQSDYERLITAYTTDFKMMVNEIVPQIERELTFDEMQAFLQSKEESYKSAIGAEIYDGISFTYRGGYAHSWNYGEYSDYDPDTRPWYQAAQEANGEIAVTAPYVTFLNASELPNTADYIVLTLAQKYNDEVSFCYDIKTYAVNELLSRRYNRYPGTFAMMYDGNGYVLSSTASEYYCHNVNTADEIVTQELVETVQKSETTRDRVALARQNGRLVFEYATLDSSGNHYYLAIPFLVVVQQNLFGIFLIAILLVSLEIWTYLRTKKQLEIELELERVKNVSQMKQDFLARMSHDMRTPMNGILGISKLSEAETNVAVLRENMEKIHTSGRYLLGLINDSLDLQKIEQEKLVLYPTVVSTTQLIQNSVDMIKLSAEKKGIRFSVTNKNANLGSYIRIDAMRMQQIFVNLLSNAIKFTPPGGEVELSIEVLGREGNLVHDRLSVRDTGIGMSEEFIRSGLFKPFSQEHSELTNIAPGTGLGLSIVKRLVELMGATISVKSELGKGTVFIIDIDFECVEAPNSDGKDAPETVQKTYDRKAFQGKHILLAEDHPLNAEIATRVLKKVGCLVTWAKDGQKCLDLFQNSDVHAYDLILMDIRMPVLDGLETARKIRALQRPDAASIPILAMSANAYEEDVEKSLQAGMNAHLSKPIEVEQLYQKLAQWLSK